MTTVATERRRPLHIAWMVSLSASVYVVNLAAVAAMQASSDNLVADQQASTQSAIDQLRANDARITQEIEQAAANLQAGTAIYAGAGKTLADLEHSLAGLGKSASGLRSLPAVPRIGSGSVAAPAVHTTTGASGAKP